MTENQNSVSEDKWQMGNRTCKASGCITILSRYNTSDYCAVHKNMVTKKLRGELSIGKVRLKEYAQFYGFAQGEQASLRRFEKHVAGKEPIVLGIAHAGQGYIFYCKLGEIVGPLPGGETRVLLLPATKSAVPFTSGLSSGLPTFANLNCDKQHPEATVSVAPCHSGKLVQIFYTLKS